MKRRTSLLLLFLTAWLLTVPALADVAWEPENSFYKRNERQCEPEERFYWVNGPEGYLTLREEPNGKPIANVKNGVRFYVNGTYEKGGVRWGLVNYNLNDGTDSYLAVAGDAETGWNEAWLSMEDMVLYYDQQCFREDHAGELTSEQKTFTVAGKASMSIPAAPSSGRWTLLIPGRWSPSRRPSSIPTRRAGSGAMWAIGMETGTSGSACPIRKTQTSPWRTTPRTSTRRRRETRAACCRCIPKRRAFLSGSLRAWSWSAE